jgi:hypothetical protein
VVLCEAVDEQKRKASTSREQTGRAFFAKSAIVWAIASGSPALYGETLIWARRFVRDPVSSVISKGYRHERALAVSCTSDCSLDSYDELLDPPTFLFYSFPIVPFLSLRELESHFFTPLITHRCLFNGAGRRCFLYSFTGSWASCARLELSATSLPLVLGDTYLTSRTAYQ